MPAKPCVFAAKAALEDQAATNLAVQGLLEQLPAAARLGGAANVLVKPNLMRRQAPDKAATTHPSVLRAVLLALRQRGVRSITVADSPGGPYTPGAMRGVFAASGLGAVCAELGATAYTACQSRVKPGPGKLVKAFTFIAPALEADFVVNLPKMKTHVLMGVSGAVKNLFGLVPGLQKPEFHARYPERERFAEMLVDLCETAAADIHLVDGLLAMEGDGPGSGRPRRCDLLLAGENPYTVDLAICRAMGFDAMAVPFLKAANARGLCGASLDESLLLGGSDARAVLQGYTPPRSYSGNMDFAAGMPAFIAPLMPLLARWASPRPAVRRAECTGCGKCAESCPQNIISLAGGKARIRNKGCIHCFCCHEMCPPGAIRVRRNALLRGRSNTD